MKWTVALCILLLPCLVGAAHANVGVFAGYGHSIELTSTEDIQMVSEDVTIIPGRGRFLFDGSVPGMDRVEYDCRFVLKNLKAEKVTIQVGFPLDTQFLRAPYDNKKKTSEMVAKYSFIAQEDDRQYSVRYVPGDREKGLTNVFLWDMTFKPDETKTLRVTYAMPMSFSLASAAVDRASTEYGKDWYRFFEDCTLEWFGYVTSTGRSWSGKIAHARFRVFVRGFEEYVRQRPHVEKVDDAKEEEELREMFPVRLPIVLRVATPGGWKAGDDGFLTWTIQDYEPGENLEFRYFMLSLPRSVEDLKSLVRRLFPKGISAEDRQDLADIFREFNGAKTGNKRIQKFIKNQVWFGKEPQQRIPDAVIKTAGGA